MPSPNNSNNVSWKVLSVLVTIAMASIVGLAALSRTADARIENSVKDSVEKLDESKVEKDVFNMYMDTQEIYRVEQKEQWKEVNGKLNKALGIE